MRGPEEEIVSLARSLRSESSCLSSPLSPHTPRANDLKKNGWEWGGRTQGVKVPYGEMWKRSHVSLSWHLWDRADTGFLACARWCNFTLPAFRGTQPPIGLL